MPQHHQGVRFTSSLGRATLAAIRKVEEELGVTFPDDYRAFLLAVNGGVPAPHQFKMAKSGRPGEEIGVDFFYGVAATRRRAHDLRREQEEIVSRTDSLPEGFITIGHDGGGAPYFISTTGKGAGGIYFFDPDGFLDPGGEPKLYLVARNFADLLARMAAGE
jgi:hypothetical protein